MSGRRARQWREADARMKALPACTCGGGWQDGADGVIYVTPHSMECEFLQAIADLSRRGICSNCGYRVRQIRRGFFRKWWCPRGHGYGMSMEFDDAGHE